MTHSTLSLTEARERLRRTLEEYLRQEGELRALEDTNYRVCIFGSARIWPDDPIYEAVFALARSLSERGIDVVTGGGPGLMEAANRGVLAASDRRSQSIGLPLDLPTLVEPPNPHLDIKSAHKRFSSRLDEFIRLSHAVVVAPGGIGTLLELLYVWQLLQLQTVDDRPVILLGREYWRGLIEWMQEMPASMRLMDLRDLETVSLVDAPEEALAILDASHRGFETERERRVSLRPGVLFTAPVNLADWTAEATEELAEELGEQVHFAEMTLERLQHAA